MVLTEKTLQVLKNYSNINRNILIKEGNVLKTISEAVCFSRSGHDVSENVWHL
jgi:hypothetical protein